MSFAILEITDGSTSVNLISPLVGLHLNGWKPSVIQPKGGGTYQSSSLAPFRRPVNFVDADGNEVFDLKINGHGQDALIRDLQNFFRLLLKGRSYFPSKTQDVPVYIRARASCETNIWYGHIVNFTVEQLDNPFAQPFISANLVAAMDEITLGIERLHWAANPPGEGSCAAASGVQNWLYQDEWTVNDASPVANVSSLLLAGNGSLYAGEDGQIWRSVDNGASWGVNTALPAGVVGALLQTGNGYIYAGDNGQILRSTDDGASWGVNTALPAGVIRSLVQLENGYILAGDLGQILRSTDNGASWAVVTTEPVSFVRGIVQIPATSDSGGGEIIAIDRSFGNVFRSTDNGATWKLYFSFGTAFVPSSLIYASADDSLYIGLNGQINKSTDGGASWFVSTLLPTADVETILETTGDTLYSGGNTNEIFISEDNGESWQLDSILSNTILRSLLEVSPSFILAGDNGRILQKLDTTTPLGRAATCANEVFVSNKQNLANLTHIKIDDGGVFADIFPATLPQTLLPAVPVVNDALYFGIDINLTNIPNNSGPFTSLVVDLETIVSSTTSYTLIWEYWNGAWVALTLRDNTRGTGVFDQIRVNSVHFEHPSDWVTTAVDGITGYWVRLRLSALTGTLTPPIQQNRDIYSIVQPFAELASTVVLGDVPAIARIRIENQSDEDGRGGSAPDLWDNRAVVGLRSVSRNENDGGNFQAYLNISDEQNPAGVTIAAGTNTTIGADIQTPTGRRGTYNPVGVEAMATRITISLSPSIARDFYGEYHAFLRARRTGGAVADFDVQLQISTGSGGIQNTTESVQLQTTTAFEVLDFGPIEIPVFGTLKSSDLGDQTEIRIQASAANAAIDLYLYDIVLIPTDEWAGDFVDFFNQAESIVGRENDIPRLLDLDSITNPKSSPQALVRQAGSEFISSAYDPITNGDIILQANAEQRLWVFAMQTDAVGSSPNWIAPFEIAHSIQIFHNDRYLGLRGEG